LSKVIAENETHFRRHQNLTAVVAAVVGALGLFAIAYFFFSSPGEKTSTQAAQAPAAVQARPVIAVQEAFATVAQASPNVLERSPASAPAAAWPDPSSMKPTRAQETVETAPKVAPTAPLGSTTPQTVSGSLSRDVVYLQRSGVNIRSTPSTDGNALGTAPKGTRFQVTNREGEWVQVESGRLKGWINARFLASNEPR
jgi:uncharacterized protein YgiM (DUF1202 family)